MTYLTHEINNSYDGTFTIEHIKSDDQLEYANIIIKGYYNDTKLLDFTLNTLNTKSVKCDYDANWLLQETEKYINVAKLIQEMYQRNLKFSHEIIMYWCTKYKITFSNNEIVIKLTEFPVNKYYPANDVMQLAVALVKIRARYGISFKIA